MSGSGFLSLNRFLIVCHSWVERLDITRIGGRGTKYLLRLKIGKVDVVGCHINVGVGSFCKSRIATSVISHHT